MRVWHSSRQTTVPPPIKASPPAPGPPVRRQQQQQQQSRYRTAAASKQHQQQQHTSRGHYLVSSKNQHVQPAQPGEIQPLQLGKLQLDVPLLAAPMAGITAAPLRLMYTQAGARLAVSEMVIASTLQRGSRASRHLARFHESEVTRSVQLYGVQPHSLDWACRYLVNEAGVQHIDLNFGCPVRKVTSRGGGSALPLRPQLFRRLVAAAVAAVEGSDVAVTVKLRMGLNPELLTYLQAGQIAAAEGVAGLVLHARTADQQYGPPVHWEAVARLVQAVAAVSGSSSSGCSCPVIGNGDVFEAADAVELMRQTGCQGVMVGRAALGRPFLFTEAAAMMSGRLPDSCPPPLGGVLQLALEHLTAWVHWEQDELSAVLKMRKLIPCYLAGFTSCRRLQGGLFAAQTLADWQAAVSDPDRWGFDPAEPYPIAALRQARLKGAGGAGGAGQQVSRVVLPAGWLEDTRDSFDEEWMAQEGNDAACEG